VGPNKSSFVDVTSSLSIASIGKVNLEGKQFFRKYNRFNEDTFYEYLKQMHYKFPKCYLLLDKEAPHYKSQSQKVTLFTQT
jgi:hypothetical protein